ncbi:MAG: right-handed parallel beta-helix repeat-containing protein [Casimicrobiaceae bacterium]
MSILTTRRIVELILLAMTLPSLALAAQRTFVSGSGNDAAACTIVAPCRSFSAALALTGSAGEVIVLDSAGYGPVTIGQSVSITAPSGVYAGITTGLDGITISGPNVKVILRNLVISAGHYGVFVTAGATGSVVELYSLSIAGPGSRGIRHEADSRLYIRDTAVSGMSDCYSADTLTGIAKMTIEHSSAADCYQGYFAGGNTQLVIKDSSAFGRGTGGASVSYAGFIAEGSTIAGGYISCEGCLATNNLFGAVGSPYGGGSASVLRISNSSLFKNNGGVGLYGGSTAISFGNNRIRDNGPTYGDGSFSQTVSPY